MKTTLKSTLVENQGTRFLSDEAPIREWLDKYEVKNYSINGDMTVSVNGPLVLDSKNLEEIPVKFSEISGSIDVTDNRLKRIDWAPSVVNGDFDAWDNEIETLVGGPTRVEGSMDLDSNHLTNLQGAPKKINKCFVVSKNKLSSLSGCPEIVGGYFKAVECDLSTIDDLPREIGTNLYLQNNEITSLKGIGKLLKRINTTNSNKGGIINISDNSVQSGLSSVLSIKGIKAISYETRSQNNKDLAEILKQINSSLADGEDVLDIQEKLLNSDFASLA